MAQELTERLLAWYRKHARDLPWRNRRDPYAIWVSEIMLQQTRVEAVLPYYRAFMQRFPDLQSLADADQRQVLKLWEGMGYYARARNLHRAAQIVAEQHGGRLPEDGDQLTELPGIGRYTAAALRAFAFGADELALEGNLRRVLSRLFEVKLDPRSPAGERELRRVGESLLPPGRASQFNQALMDLGATVCTPQTPACERCPLQPDCLAYRHGTQAELPRRSRRSPQPERQAVAVIWQTNGQVLIRRQPPEGLLGGLWGFPGGFLEQGEQPLAGLRRLLSDELGVRLASHAALPPLRHTFSHFKLVLHPFRCEVEIGSRRLRESDEVRWVDTGQLNSYPMGRLDRQLADQL